ncbi:MAG: tripartite tricarboxylate transporter substrate binding protein [Acetobacteraceae bacterium]|nr:tripartite tricarboxylate transporter substrate binding protein [Acetobacteraceae bacterium]
MTGSTPHPGRRAVLAGAAALPMAPLAARAQGAAWPERTVTIIVSFPPGGSSDIAARLVAPAMQEILGRPVVVENRGGAGGNIGIGAVARAQPDGYTLLCSSSAFVVNPSLYRNAPYDPFRDFQPISTLGASPNVLVVRPESRFATLRDLLDYARANPDRLNWASPATGTTPHLAGEIIRIRAGVKVQHIGYTGAGPAVQAALAGQIDYLVAHQGSLEQQLRSGQLRPLAHTGTGRQADWPDLPSVAEFGIQGAESDTFLALYAPAAVPSPVMARIVAATVEALKRPDMRERFRRAGMPVPETPGPEELTARVAREVPLWRDVIRQAGITVE